MIFSKVLLFPYYLALKVRHLRYDRGIIGSTAYLTQIISVGNVTVGGTGKTPMVEYIVRLLGRSRRIAVLSRGYKGTNKGFHIVEAEDSASLVGDEPLQIKRKFPRITVAVDRDRRKGVESLQTLMEAPDLIVLDDGFQRRDIIPAKNILLIDYNRPIFSDELLPLGRLRDLPEQIRRADAVVFTKCPAFVSEEERAAICRKSHVCEGQKTFFAGVSYGKPKAVFKGIGNNRYIYAREAIVFAGIANPKPMFDYLSKNYRIVGKWILGDHHRFRRDEILEIACFAARHPYSIIMTTEKDAQRLLDNEWLTRGVKERLYYLPIETEFITAEDKAEFLKYLKS